MTSTNLTFTCQDEHRAWLATQAAMPLGFRVGATRLSFLPAEVARPAAMSMVLIVLDRPTADFAAVFTRNAFPGAPVLVGRQRLDEETVGAVVVNNKIANVCAPGGVDAAERLCAGAAGILGLTARQVIPSSTGVIGWQLPVAAMLGALPEAAQALGRTTLVEAAQGIMTTDLYPKVRRATVGGGSIVGIAKGAGMIEPNLATMLVYLLTDLAVPRPTLRKALAEVARATFNAISIDSETSTSDSVVLLSSGRVACPSEAEFVGGLEHVCGDLAEDVVRNGEGVRHVVRLSVTGAPDDLTARGLGKAVANAPLLKCAIAGNDPNVGRVVAAAGRYLGTRGLALDPTKVSMRLGGHPIFAHGCFALDAESERQLAAHLAQAELYPSSAPAEGVFRPPIAYPPHERCVQLEIDLGAGPASATVLGADLTHEYVSENADYRS